MWQVQATASLPELDLASLLCFTEPLGNLTRQHAFGIQLSHSLLLRCKTCIHFRLADDALIFADTTKRTFHLLELEHAKVVDVRAKEIGLSEIASDESVNDTELIEPFVFL